MIEFLLEPFGYQYMVKAIWVSALVGGVKHLPIRYKLRRA